MNEYRINKAGLSDILSAWSAFLKRRIHLVACGGTAMTLLNIKASTKDIDFIVPNLEEYKYLTAKLTELGYIQTTQYGWSKDEGFIFDLYPGNAVYITELINSPLDAGGNIPYKEFDRIYVGILNFYDILITKLFRASSVDIDDCLGLFRHAGNKIDLIVFKERFCKTASRDIGEEKVLKNLGYFIQTLKKEKLI